MDAKALELHTVSDIEEMDDDVRAELIDGQIYYMAAPDTLHQDISMRLSVDISIHIRNAHKNCKVYAAPFAVYLNDENYNYVEPDISVICDKTRIDERGCHGAPDWIIEIVSPSSIRMDHSIKLFKYRDAGVKEYWIVDPSIGEIQVHDLEREDYFRYSFEEPVPCRHMEGLEIDLSEFHA